MSTDVQVTTRDDAGVTVIEVGGEIDAVTVVTLKDALERALPSATGAVVVDLRDVSFLDSTGLGVLVSAMKAARRGGVHFRLVSDTARVRRVFEITGLDTVVPLDTDLSSALAAARSTT